MIEEPMYCPVLLNAPCLKAEVWAAWAQAILSAAAIWYAHRLANNQDRQGRKRRLDAIMSLVVQAEDKASVAYARAVNAAGGVLDGKKLGFANLAATFEAVPMHDLPDIRLIPVIDDARHACQSLNANFDLQVGTNSWYEMSRCHEVLASLHVLEGCANTAMLAANDAVEIRVRWKVRRWFRRLLTRKAKKVKSRPAM